jgi:hypothetical protein
LARVSTPNWALEWSLPYWLGQAFGLPDEETRALTAANVIGLAYVRLQDDLVDGEPGIEAGGTGPLLATALYHLWLESYRPLFEAASPFWRSFDAYLLQWLRGTLHDRLGMPGAGVKMVNEAQALELAARGAPLKVGATGACLRASREQDVRAAELTIDSLLAAAVLLDHAQDWREDLAAGRYNAFVASAARREDKIGDEGGLERAVLAELFLGDAAQPYFALIQRLIGRARTEAQPLACDGLERYLDFFEQSVASHSARLAAHAARELRAGVDRFLALAGEPIPS